MGVCVPRKSANKNIYFIDSPDQLKITPELFIIQKKENPSINYRIIGYLGEGSFGKVYSVEHNELKIKRAMKIIPIKPQNSYQFINKEIKILKSLDHPNIIKVYEFYLTKTSLSIICELCEGGDLYEKLKSEKKYSMAICGKKENTPPVPRNNPPQITLFKNGFPIDSSARSARYEKTLSILSFKYTPIDPLPNHR